jgi:hypothetical protein
LPGDLVYRRERSSFLSDGFSVHQDGELAVIAIDDFYVNSWLLF